MLAFHKLKMNEYEYLSVCTCLYCYTVGPVVLIGFMNRENFLVTKVRLRSMGMFGFVG